MDNFTFSKKERLCSEKLIDDVFLTGHKLMVYPLSVHWKTCPKETLPGVPCQVLIATSKKKFHHAVDRNRVKRLTRECYRQYKPQLYAYLEQHDLALLLTLNYVHNQILNYHTLDKKMDKVVASIIKALEA